MSTLPPEPTASARMGRTDAPAFPRLDHDRRADLCVVGGGISGLSVAYEAALAGRVVVLLEAGDIGRGETARSTAHLATAIDDRFLRIERVHGREGARLSADSHGRAIDRIAEITRVAEIPCGFERLDGYLFAGPDTDRDTLSRERDAARRAGLSDVELVAPPAPLELGRCVRFPRQAQIDPLAYVHGLARALTRVGGAVFTASRVQTIEGRGPVVVRVTGGAAVTAADVVVATNAPVNDLFALHLKQVAYRSYAVAATAPKDSVPRGLYWDTLDPYHYVRVDRSDPAQDLLIVGGEDHKTGHESDPTVRWDRLEQWMRLFFPMARDVVHRWSGQIHEPSDGVAFIGKNPGDDHVFVVTGDSGMGITHGAIAGLLLADLLAGRDNPWAKLYAPSRIKDVAQILRDDVGAILPYADWVKPGGDDDDIPRGEGAIVRERGALLAVYRDEEGALHRCGAACPHLGAVVRWNAAEKSWDCPAHGSRFDARGAVLCGPANADLKRP
ncbi:MAG: FAD-dependent oxidoreductase [Polyangiaceae bacterium]